VIRELQKTNNIKLVSRPKKLGLGSAYRDGGNASSGDFIILMDADLSHHPKYLKDLIK
jgi:dolichol-phosphate mannosyltransferase